jgi:hypothetical protein
MTMWKGRQSMASIYEAISAVMADVDAIGKTQKNKQQNFDFRGIDDVYNAVHPLLAKHGVFTVPTVLAERTEERQTGRGSNLIYRILTIKYTFYSSDGSSLDAVVIGEGMDGGDKAANKAMAVGHKYALLQALCIPTADMVDPDSESHESSTRVDNQSRPVQSQNQGQGKFDPKKASMKQVTGMVKANMGVNLLNHGLFSIKRAWNQILELCDNDVDFAKGLFAQFGADSSDKITYEIYKQVFDSIKNPVNETSGPEDFIDDDIPFGMPAEETA